MRVLRLGLGRVRQDPEIQARRCPLYRRVYDQALVIDPEGDRVVFIRNRVFRRDKGALRSLGPKVIWAILWREPWHTYVRRRAGHHWP